MVVKTRAQPPFEHLAGRAHLVEHVVSSSEWSFCDTDAALTG